MKQTLNLALLFILLNSCSLEMKTDELLFHPISHGSFIIEHGEEIIYIDPVGKIEDFKDFKKPTLIMITDIHGDHLNVETLQNISNPNVTFLIPEAVNQRLNESIEGKRIIIKNGETKTINGMDIEAIPMYNLREEALKFHEKGRGNGYIINRNKTRVYISGDTEDIPEMRALKNIDIAFVCMNLPWTMTVESAADAILEFKPRQVFPYHYRGIEGFSDINQFKSLINSKNNTIDVKLLDWYSER